MLQRRVIFFGAGLMGLLIGLLAASDPDRALSPATPPGFLFLAFGSGGALALLPLAADFLRRKSSSLYARLAHEDTPPPVVADYDGVHFGMASGLTFSCAGFGMVLSTRWIGTPPPGEGLILIAFGLGLLLSSHLVGRRLDQREHGHE